MTKKIILSIASGLIVCCGYSQKYYARYFDDVFFTDSTSTMFFPTRYNDQLLSDNKISLGGDYYANIIVYNYVTDSYHKLFPNDCYIASLKPNYYDVNMKPSVIKNMSRDWIFLFVKQHDTNSSGRIDEKDASILYVMSIKGEKLQALTDKSENATSLQIFGKQGFALVKIQRDSDDDGSFKLEDKDFYYRKIDLKDLSLGQAVELTPGL